jgi:hypothetical protein
MHLHKADQFLYDMLPQQGLFFGQKVGTPKALDSHLEDGETFSFSDPEISTLTSHNSLPVILYFNNQLEELTCQVEIADKLLNQ